MENQKMDVLIAENIMGYEKTFHEMTKSYGWKVSEYEWKRSFSPSTNVEDAWKVLEKIQKDKGWEIEIKFASDGVKVCIGKIQEFLETFPKTVAVASLKAFGLK